MSLLDLSSTLDHHHLEPLSFLKPSPFSQKTTMTQGNLHTDLKVNSTDSIHAHFEAVLKQATEALRADTETHEEPGKIITRVGECLVRAAESWSLLTDDLIQAPQMNGVINDAHEKARTHSHLCDLSSVVQADIEISKLRMIQDLTAEFSRNVREVWSHNSQS